MAASNKPKRTASGNPATRRERMRAAAEAQRAFAQAANTPEKLRKDAKAQKPILALLYLGALASLGFGIYWMVGGHNQAWVTLIVPIAFVVAAQLVPKGWRG